MTSARTEEILNQCLSNTATAADREELVVLLQSPENREVARHLMEVFLLSEREGQSLGGVRSEAIIRAIMDTEKGSKTLDPDHGYSVSPTVHRVHFLRTAWFRYAAAVIAILGISSYLWFTNRNRPALLTTTTNSSQKKFNSNIAPGGNRATLRLADGSEIMLDNTANGTLAQQGNAQVIKLANGQLAYQLKGSSSSEVMMNTMTTPRGGQYKIQLPDGTNVWLNAASSLTYPTAFLGKTREVAVQGEAYFEVAPNKSQPFFVKTKASAVQVLGTSFNVNAYEEDPYKVSLVEGSIKVNNQLLTPGQAYANGKVLTTDIEQDMAWKNGVFNFNHLPLKQVMNQLARWYDLEIIYKDKLPDIDYFGKMNRETPLDVVLKGLSGMGGVAFQIEGKKLIVVAEE